VNRDGYQDGASNTGRQVTNQDVFTDGKGGKAGKLAPAPAEPRGEPGLPGVRLVTTDGTIITTDNYGRYSVPCAALPNAIGQNFTLKVDTTSLPTGYRMSTENPRTMRVTAGKMTEMNFGASIGRVIDIDLTARAFDANNNAVPQLAPALRGLLAPYSDEKPIVRLSYFTDGETKAVGRARLGNVQRLIENIWSDIGRHRLLFERSVQRLQ